MSVKINFIVWTAAAIALLLFIGCHSSPPTRTDLQLDNPPVRNSASSEQQSPTAIESAVALSDKYANLSEEATALRQKKQSLETENQQLKEKLHDCQTQMENTKKELAQANDLLVQTRLELNNWKNDVLGFRGEMREAQKVQLETLFKILQLMGGDVNLPDNMQTQGAKEQK
jgi:septal ring factor EnvC (AmiA/AmiB activator)